MGFYIGVLSLIFGFAMTWHILWLTLLTLIAIIGCVIVRLSGEDEHEKITAAQVKEMDLARGGVK